MFGGVQFGTNSYYVPPSLLSLVSCPLSHPCSLSVFIFFLLLKFCPPLWSHHSSPLCGLTLPLDWWICCLILLTPQFISNLCSFVMTGHVWGLEQQTSDPHSPLASICTSVHSCYLLTVNPCTMLTKFLERSYTSWTNYLIYILISDTLFMSNTTLPQSIIN